MNLSVKTKFIGALLMGLVFIFSCEELGPFGLGEDDIAPLEFLTTEVTTSGGIVLLDSIQSIGTGTILTGQRATPFGQVNAKAHTSFFIDVAQLIRPDAEATLDSVKLNLKFNYLYDTDFEDSRIALRAYRILKDFPDTNYVTSSVLPVSDQLIAENTLNVTDLDSVYTLNVDQAWADQVFNALIDSENPLFDALANFRAFFPGLAFQSDEPLNNIFGIDTGEDVEIRFYISEPASDGSGLTENRQIVFNGSFSPHFYSLDIDRSATDYVSVQDPKIEYPVSNNLLVHSGAGIVPKVDISNLTQFSNDQENSIVNLVELSVGPIVELDEGVSPPRSLYLYFTDEQNTPIPDGRNLRGIQQDGVSVLSSQFPVRLNYDADTRTYKNSITSYVQNYYNNILRRNYIFLYPVDLNSSVNGFEVNPADINIKIFYSQLR